MLAETLVRSCSGVSVLATSREPLGVAGEAVWRVPSLAEDEAVRLFTSRAALVRSGPACDADDDAARVICRRLDGIPLAVELAAAWVRALTPAQIAAGMGDRFRMLTGGPRGVVARHRTLAASMQWSYDLLDEADRAVFRRLAVFAGGFTIDAARAVSAGDEVCEGDVLATVGRLIDKSLVNVQEGNNEFRYRMLDTIQQYAQDRLRDSGELAGTRDRHLDHFLVFAELAEPQLDQDQDRWRAALQAEHDNFRAALEWAFTAAEPDRGRRLAAALARFWFLHGHTTDGLGFLQQAIDLTPDDRSPLQASLLFGLALVAFGGGRPG
jgi:predicted ATPase